MSVETIAKALQRIYEVKEERIVVWYDEEGAFKQEYDALALEGVEKLTVDHNRFWVKYRIYYEAPKGRFLVYIPYANPADRDNWLLEFSLCHYEFKADASSMTVQEFGLDLRLKPMIDRYAKFFRNSKLKRALHKRIQEHEDDQSLLHKIIATLTGAVDESLEEILYVLLGELSEGKESKYANLVKYQLDGAWWQWVGERLGYRHAEPTLMGLAIYLLENRFGMCVKEEGRSHNKEASLFVNHWMQHMKHNRHYRTLAKQIENELQIKSEKITTYTLEELLGCDTYEGIEQTILSQLTERLTGRAINREQIEAIITQRKSTYWYADFASYYDALYYAAAFFELEMQQEIDIQSIMQGIELYTEHLYRFDLLYRNYMHALSQCHNGGIFDAISEAVEKGYANRYLPTLCDAWYERLPALEKWKFGSGIDQKSFYTHHVRPQLDDGKKLCVIISDALRYESGKALDERLRREGSIRTEFGYMVASLPSYTQLGMASLLPHDEIGYAEGKDAVYVDGISSQGTQNRTRILQKHIGESIAIQAQEFLNMKKAELRAFFKPYKLVYIYENSIDATGDNRTTQDQVFEATEACFERLTRLTKKIHNDLQWRNLFITADHGYLYEKTEIDESNFCKVPRSENWLYSNKRMAIGYDLSPSPCVMKYDATQLNIAGSAEAIIARSTQRIRGKGGGSKFVHGGATPQEVIIPLIKVNRNTELKSRQVDFDVIRSSSLITSNVFPVTFLQKEPVGEKVSPLHVQVSLCSEEGELLSDVHEIIFDSGENDPQKLHKKVTFHFSKDMSALNQKKVLLKVVTKAQGTEEFNKVLTHKQESYTVNISFGAEEW